MFNQCKHIFKINLFLHKAIKMYGNNQSCLKNNIHMVVKMIKKYNPKHTRCKIIEK